MMATEIPAKKTPQLTLRGLRVRSLAVSYFRMAAATLSSALNVFTSEFEMGSGGSRSLWPPGKLLAPSAQSKVQSEKSKVFNFSLSSFLFALPS